MPRASKVAAPASAPVLLRIEPENAYAGIGARTHADLQAHSAAALPQPAARERQCVVTDAENGWLRTPARAEGHPAPPRVGGRYSVLTSVG